METCLKGIPFKIQKDKFKSRAKEGAYAMSEVVSIRFNDDEYMNILMKISNKDGKPIMSPGKFCKCAALTGKVKIFNHEVEEYKAFILGKISNNINQIAHRLNTDNVENKVSEKTYIANLEVLESLLEQVNELSQSVR